MFRVGFCVSGDGRLFCQAVKNKTVLEIDPALLVVDEKAVFDLKNVCQKNDVKYVRLTSSNKNEFGHRLASTCLEAELDLIVLTFDKIIPQKLMEHNAPIINTHMSLLPSYKGFKALERAIDEGVKYIGASIHAVTSDIDGGSIISQCLVFVGPNDTSKSIGMRLFTRLELMYLQVIAWYSSNRIIYDKKGRIWVKNADYSDDFICPKIENAILRELS